MVLIRTTKSLDTMSIRLRCLEVTPDGTFSAPIVEPDAFNVTRATGISHAQTVAGWFADETGVPHGFFLNDGSYTQYDFFGNGLYYTQIYGLSDGRAFLRFCHLYAH
jgi:hypothetical protein